jgi:hypothetical protein
MVSEKDIYRTAQATIRKCGRKYHPMDYALSMAEQFHKKGDAKGPATWMRIVDAIGVFLSKKPDKPH